MVVGDFDLHRAVVGPVKAHAPLVVDANAVLILPVAAQGFEVMRRWQSQIRERRGRDDALYSHASAALNVRRQAMHRVSKEDAFGVRVLKLPHTQNSNATR